MRLVRNTTDDGKCKYAIVRLDKIRQMPDPMRARMWTVMEELQILGVLEFGEPGTREEHFVLKLKDKFARSALIEYSLKAMLEDSELGQDVAELANRSGPLNAWCKRPD